MEGQAKLLSRRFEIDGKITIGSDTFIRGVNDTISLTDKLKLIEKSQVKSPFRCTLGELASLFDELMIDDKRYWIYNR